jgi:hypothetical protein
VRSDTGIVDADAQHSQAQLNSATCRPQISCKLLGSCRHSRLPSCAKEIGDDAGQPFNERSTGAARTVPAYGPSYGPEIAPCAQKVSGRSRASPHENWWALKDSNLRPTD